MNRQDIAANNTIQKSLEAYGSQLVALPGFSKELAGRFITARIQTQPKESIGVKPSETNGPLAKSAYHTVAGLAEIICKAPENEWQAALAEHFSRVGTRDEENKAA